jgi:hypothetical protein
MNHSVPFVAEPMLTHSACAGEAIAPNPMQVSMTFLNI